MKPQKSGVSRPRERGDGEASTESPLAFWFLLGTLGLVCLAVVWVLLTM